MDAQEALRCLLDDLEKVWRVYREDHLKEMPESALNYLSDNYDAILFYIDQLYSKTDRAARQELCKEHPELHSSAVSDGFRGFASHTLDNAKDNREEKWKLGFSLSHVSDDDLDVLLRVLKYAKYVPLDARDLALAQSPIENHGLTRRVGNFLSITEEEWRAIPWHLSDMLFADQRKVAESRALTLGLDLIHRTVSEGSDIESVRHWTDLLAELLEFKVECDWAAVMQVAKDGREKYLNAVVGRVECESTGVIGRFRESLENWARRRYSEDPLGVAISDFDPLIHRYQDLLSRVRRIQPRPGVYEWITKTQSLTPNVIKELKGDLVMRDKYENVILGPGVIVLLQLEMESPAVKIATTERTHEQPRT